MHKFTQRGKLLALSSANKAVISRKVFHTVRFDECLQVAIRIVAVINPRDFLVSDIVMQTHNFIDLQLKPSGC